MYVNRNNMLSQWVDHSQIVFRLQEIMIYIFEGVLLFFSTIKYCWNTISAQNHIRFHSKTLYHSKSYNNFSGNPKLHLLKTCVCGIIEAQLSSCNLMLLRRKRSRKETKWYQKPFSEDKDFDKWRLIIIFILKFNFVSVGVYYVK